MLLIIGIMVGYLASSVTSLLNFFATEEGVKSYVVWGMGDFSGVSMRQLPAFATIIMPAWLVRFCLSNRSIYCSWAKAMQGTLALVSCECAIGFWSSQVCSRQ